MAECLIKRDANRDIVAVMDSRYPHREDQDYKSVLESFIAEGAEDNGPTREEALNLYLVTKIKPYTKNENKILQDLNISTLYTKQSLLQVRDYI